MADLSGFKGGLVIALIAGAGLTYWNKSSDAAEAKTQCLSQFSNVGSIRNPEAFCTCYVNAVMRQLSILHFIPIVRNVQPDPPDAISKQSMRSCIG